MKIYLASGNTHKKKEFQQLLPNYEIVLPCEEGIEFCPDETGSTFFENAFIKASALFEIVKRPVIADDSGLCVDALGGKPGIYSARYGSDDGTPVTAEAGINKLLNELKNEKNRQAHFTCCIVLLFNNFKFYSIQEICNGIISEQLNGQGGFGYDPVFFVSEFGKTFAQLTPDEKNSISHRGKAMKKIALLLKEGII